MEDTIKVDIAQISPWPGDISHNLKTVMEYMERTSAGESKLVIFPEMYISGYSIIGSYSKEDFLKTSVTIDDLSVTKVIKFCSKLDKYIILGLPLRDKSSDILYNAALFIGPKGIIGIHRKITLPDGNYRGQKFCEGEYFTAGSELSILKHQLVISASLYAMSYLCLKFQGLWQFKELIIWSVWQQAPRRKRRPLICFCR